MNARHWIALGMTLGAAAWTAGCASTGHAIPANHGAPVAATPSGCLTDTGSRIPAPGQGCAGVGRSYSQTDISQTGQTTAGGALGLMDPALTVHH